MLPSAPPILCAALNVRNQVLCPYQSAIKIISLGLNVFREQTRRDVMCLSQCGAWEPHSHCSSTVRNAIGSHASSEHNVPTQGTRKHLLTACAKRRRCSLHHSVQIFAKCCHRSKWVSRADQWFRKCSKVTESNDTKG
jgi:hypothetical protein